MSVVVAAYIDTAKDGILRLTTVRSSSADADVKRLLAITSGERDPKYPDVPTMKEAGFPQYDHVGGYARTWVGYRGTRQALFDLANLMMSQHHELEPYRSVYWNESRDAGGSCKHHDTPSAATGLVH